MAYYIEVKWFRKHKKQPYFETDTDGTLGICVNDHSSAADVAFECRPSDWKPGDRCYVDDGSWHYNLRALSYYGTLALAPIYR